MAELAQCHLTESQPRVQSEAATSAPCPENSHDGGGDGQADSETRGKQTGRGGLGTGHRPTHQAEGSKAVNPPPAWPDPPRPGVGATDTAAPTRRP